MKSYKVLCKTRIEDVQLETLRDNQLNVFSFSLPIGIESSANTDCEIYEVDRNGEEVKMKKIGFARAKLSIDEGVLTTEYEISDSIASLFKKFLF